MWILAFWCALYINAAPSIQVPLNPPAEGFHVISAFPGLTFKEPVAIVSPPGETNRLFVLEREGRVMVITNLANPTATLFLDLTETLQYITRNEVEAGLLGRKSGRGFYDYRR